MKIATLFSLLLLTACGGGGSSSSSAGGTVVVSGVAAKGVINAGSIAVYELVAPASKGRFIAAATTDSNGQFSVNLGSHTGGILLEVVGGTYFDEATNTTLPLPGQSQLKFRAAVSSASRNPNVSITPFTEIACQLAGSTVAPTIDDANALVNDLFKIDIISVKPVPFPNGISTATDPQREYSWALATLSQLCKSRSISIDTLIFALKSDLTDGVLTVQNAQGFVNAMYLIAQGDGTPQNPGYSMVPPPVLRDVGIKSITLKLAISGTSAQIGGLNLALILPSSVSLPYADNYQIPPSEVFPSGTASGLDTFQAAYHPASDSNPNNTVNLAIVSIMGFPAGEVATFKLKLAAGTPVPLPDPVTGSPYSIADVSVYDINNANLQAPVPNPIHFQLTSTTR
jgi:hypothetical protein